ncbi:transmembrane protein, putative [Medicago truncatula]|uniref:Transmembrane protein, putative n=1 Tax=Medicago truncatula TaxID=3880 RepID=G7LDQ9_MEDTR|nr:transmembrane protein, putative [Medicago truncatula]
MSNCYVDYDDVILILVVLTAYLSVWMGRRCARLVAPIYVPIQDCCGLWYLMVASIEEKVLYHIDPYFEKPDIHPRQDTIQNMWQAITQMAQSRDFPANFLVADKLNEDTWSIFDPIGH